ncbi:MAG: VTT domain-containing protein [Caldilineaceae bacterium]
MLSVLALIAITLGSFWAALNPGWVRQAGHWGYLGATLISFLSSATVILPAPGLAVVFSMGGVLNPVLLGILAGIGSGLGELSGYVAGASGRALISPDRTHPFVRHFTTRYTAIALFVFAILPLPIFDFAGIVAGAMRVRLPVFLGTVISGKIIKHVIIALMGAGFLPLLRVFVGM